MKKKREKRTEKELQVEYYKSNADDKNYIRLRLVFGVNFNFAKETPLFLLQMIHLFASFFYISNQILFRVVS
jgi:hypothetical protein